MIMRFTLKMCVVLPIVLFGAILISGGSVAALWGFACGACAGISSAFAVEALRCLAPPA